MRGFWRTLALQWLLSSMTRSSARRGPWWSRRRAPPHGDGYARPAPRGMSLGRFLFIALLIGAVIFLFTRFRAQPEQYDREPVPYEEPRGGW